MGRDRVTVEGFGADLGRVFWADVGVRTPWSANDVFFSEVHGAVCGGVHGSAGQLVRRSDTHHELAVWGLMSWTFEHGSGFQQV